MLLPPLVLQKPSKKSKSKDHVQYLEKRLGWWKDGDLDLLVKEGEAIQKRLKNSKFTQDDKEKVFTRLMLQGKVSAAMRWIGQNSTSVLALHEEVETKLEDGKKVKMKVIDILKDKHPESQPATEGGLLQGPKNDVENVIYNSIDGELIERCTKRMGGSAGPSGLDSDGWKRIICSKQFTPKSYDLANAVAGLAKRLCTEFVDPSYIHAYTACRLVPLDKKPGVRPVGIGEVLRRIVGKAIMTITKNDIVDATAPIQVCAGLSGGAEAAIHALRKVYNDSEVEAVMLIDADNAFNRLNRNVALHNIQHVCPEIAPYIINTYREPAKLFISNTDEEIMSQEGVTQGDNSAMAKYSCSLMPLVNSLVIQDETEKKCTKQIWYADDAAGGGKLEALRSWWDQLQETGPLFGYHPKPQKTWLIVKPNMLDKAKAMFPDIQITDEGHRYLGSYIGSDTGKEKYVEEKVHEWIHEIKDI